MMNMDAETESQETQAEPEKKEPAGSDIDLQELAKEIYRLLKKDLILGNERIGRRGGSYESH